MRRNKSRTGDRRRQASDIGPADGERADGTAAAVRSTPMGSSHFSAFRHSHQAGNVVDLDFHHPEIGVESRLAGDDVVADAGVGAFGAALEAAVVVVRVEGALRRRPVKRLQPVAEALADEDRAGFRGAPALDGGEPAVREDTADKGGRKEFGGDAHGMS